MKPRCAIDCSRCREDSAWGRIYRRRITSALGIGNGPDLWPCPFGVGWPWWRKLLNRLRLGDKVEAVTKAAGVPTCGGCQRRKAILNGEALNTGPKA